MIEEFSFYNNQYFHEDTAANPFGRAGVGEVRPNGELQEYLRLGGRLSEWHRRGAETIFDPNAEISKPWALL